MHVLSFPLRENRWTGSNGVSAPEQADIKGGDPFQGSERSSICHFGSLASLATRTLSAQLSTTTPCTATPRQVIAAGLMMPLAMRDASAAARMTLAGNLTSIRIGRARTRRRAIALNDIQNRRCVRLTVYDDLGSRL